MLDLFSGIGGFALAASWVWADELELVGFCENENYCQRVLAKNFPDVPIYDDIRELEVEWFDDIDLLTGGFPCQDISVAGKGEGIEGERSGLWFEMLRLISGIRPRYALIENVPMLLHRGLGRVICDLAQIGYDAEWQIISAADLGAPHLRKRIWIVAYPISINGGNPHRSEPSDSLEGKGPGEPDRARGGSRTMADSDQSGLEGRHSGIMSECAGQQSAGARSTSASGPDGYWLTEPNVGRVADGVPHRVDRLRGLGNAIVPQCAALIMERIRYEFQ
jgi:DNA (cytosine-5)-methyltransferase 1